MKPESKKSIQFWTHCTDQFIFTYIGQRHLRRNPNWENAFPILGCRIVCRTVLLSLPNDVTLNTVPQGVVSPLIKLFSLLLLCNCDFATIMNRNASVFGDRGLPKTSPATNWELLSLLVIGMGALISLWVRPTYNWWFWLL